MKILRTVLKVLGCLGILVITGFVFFLVAFFSFTFTSEFWTQSTLKIRCVDIQQTKPIGENIIYDFSEMKVGVRYVFHENGLIEMVVLNKGKDKQLGCVAESMQTQQEYKSLKKYILDRYNKTETHSADTPVFGQYITVSLNNFNEGEDFRVGYYCHRTPKKFNEIRTRINQTVKAKLDEDPR